MNPLKKLTGMGFSLNTIRTMNPRHFKDLTGTKKQPRFFRKARPTARAPRAPKLIRVPRKRARPRVRDPRAIEARALEQYKTQRRTKMRSYFKSDLFDKAHLDSTLKGRTHRGESFREIERKYLYGEF